MKTNVLDLKGNKVEDITLSDKVFAIDPVESVLNLYVRVYLSNRRQGNSSTKTRGEVAGSGRKPWAQKGTGRARVGDKRNPVWRKGGISHGPKPKDWTLDINKKVKKLAMVSALSLKFKTDKALVLDAIKISSPKTKEVADIVKSLKVKGKSLFVLDSIDSTLIKGCSNLKNVSTAFVDNINPYDLMVSKNVIFTKKSVKKLEERYK